MEVVYDEDTRENKVKGPFFSYLLASKDLKRTYIGATTDVHRRLSQHNGERAGGARATSGKSWTLVCYAAGFPSWVETLKFEWAWKHAGGRRVLGKWQGFHELVARGKSSSKSVPFVEWPAGNDLSLCVTQEGIDVLGKIDKQFMRIVKVGAVLNSFPSYKLISAFFPSKMSASVPLSPVLTHESFLALRGVVDDIRAQMTEALTKINIMMVEGASVPAATAEKKAGRPKKGKVAAAAAAAPTNLLEAAPEAAAAAAAAPEKKVRKPRAKAVCPEATEGVMRFFKSTDPMPQRTFSPLYKHSFTLNGVVYPTLEHYLAHAKFITTDPEYAAEMLKEKNAALLGARAKSSEHKGREDYDAALDELLLTGLTAKFADASMRDPLRATGDVPLEYASPRDSVLGIGKDGKGQNKLGRALMTLRLSL